jgi:hypothetical protein
MKLLQSRAGAGQSRFSRRKPEIASPAPGGVGRGREDSDIDLVLLVEDPDRYLRHPEWVGQFGDVTDKHVEYYGMVTSLRVIYGDGREVEYGVTNPRWAAEPLDEGTRRVIRDGMRVIFERGTILSRHLSPSPFR